MTKMVVLTTLDHFGPVHLPAVPQQLLISSIEKVLVVREDLKNFVQSSWVSSI